MASRFTQQVLSALRWVAVGRFAAQLVSWAVTLLVIRILSPSDYGLMAIAGVLIGLAMPVNELGLIPALIRAKEPSAELMSRVFGYVLLTNGVLFAAVFTIAPWFAAFFANEALTPLVRVVALHFLIAPFGAVPRALLKRRIEFRGLSILGGAATVTASLVSLVLAVSGFGVWALVGASLCMVSVETIGVWLLARFKLRPSLRLDGMGQLFSFGAWVSGGRVTSYLGESAGNVIIGKLLGDGPLGVYSIAQYVSTTPMAKIMGTLNQVAFPAYSRLDGDIDRARAYFLKSLQLAGLVFFSSMWGISSVAQDFTTVVLGTKWVGALLPLKLLSIAVPFRVVGDLLNPLADALGRPDIAFRNVVTSVSAASLAVLLGTLGGVNGVAWALTVTYSLVMLVNLRRSLVVLRCSWTSFLTSTAGAALSGCVMYASVHYAAAGLLGGLDAAPRLVACVGVGVVSFAAATFVLNRSSVRLLANVVRTSWADDS